LSAPALTRRPTRGDWLLVLGIAVVATFIRGVIALGHASPIVYQDEFAYFRLASWFADQGANPHLAYYPGYALLLAPAFLGSDDGFGAYRAAIVENVLLCPVGILLAFATARRVAPTASRGVLAAALAGFALYPPVVIYAGLTWAENALPLLILASALAVGWAFDRGGPAWILPGVVAGAAFLTHPRGLACVIALVAIVLVAAIVRLVTWRDAAVALVSAAASLVAVLLIVRAVSPPGDHYRPETVSPLRFVEHPRDCLVALAGAVLYALLSTFGLALAGLAAAAVASVRIVRRAGTAGDLVVVSLALACLGMLVFSTLAASNGIGLRADYLVYGRYGEPGYAALIVTGIVWLASGPPRRLKVLAGAALLAGVCAVFLVHVSPAGALAGPANFVNILGIVVLIVRAGGLRPEALVLWSLPVIGALALAIGTVRRWQWVLPCVVAVVFGAATSYAFRYWLRPVTVPSAALRRIPDRVADLAAKPPGLRCVAFHTADESGLPSWRVTYFTGIPVDPAPTQPAAAAACGGVLILPPGETPALGTVVESGPDGQLVVTR
jgi:hypothetical protein